MRMQRKTFRTRSAIGVNRIKDGFYIGDEFSVRIIDYNKQEIINHMKSSILIKIDEKFSIKSSNLLYIQLLRSSVIKEFEFQEVNKITHFVNCAGKQVTNRNNKLLSFLTFNWLENDKQVLFEEDGSSLQQLVDFLREAENNGEAILVHSQKGINRSVCAIIAYFMADYKWSLSKCIEYITIRRPGIKIQQNFLAQLAALEQKLKESNQGATSSGWDDSEFIHEQEELVKNTYINSKTTATQQAVKRKIFNLNQMKKENIKLRWSDQQPGGRLNNYFGVPQRKNFKITTVNHHSPTKYGAKGLFGSMSYNTNSFYQQQMKDKQQEQNEINIQAQAAQKAQFLSILKGSKKCFDKQTGNIISNEEGNQESTNIFSNTNRLSELGEQYDQQNLYFQESRGSEKSEGVIEMSRSLSPQKQSSNDQNKRYMEVNPMSLSEQFGKPQQSSLIKNVFKTSSQTKNESNEQTNKPMANNFTNPNSRNTLANIFSKNSNSAIQNSSLNQQNGQMSPSKVLNAPLRVSHLISADFPDISLNNAPFQQSPSKGVKSNNPSLRVSELNADDSPYSQLHDIPEENANQSQPRSHSQSPQKSNPVISNISQYSNEAFKFRRQNFEKVATYDMGGSMVQFDISNRNSELLPNQFNSVPEFSSYSSQNLAVSDVFSSICFDPQTNSYTQQNTQISSKVNSLPKNVNSLFKIIQIINILNENKQNSQLMDIQERPSTAQNNNQEKIDDVKFSTQRVGDNTNNIFKSVTEFSNRAALYSSRVRPSSMDQQNRVLKQSNKKPLQQNRSNTYISTNNQYAKKPDFNNSMSSSGIRMNAQSVNNYVNNQQKTQNQYKTSVQSYIKKNTINQFSNSNLIQDTNDIFKKRIK